MIKHSFYLFLFFYTYYYLLFSSRNIRTKIINDVLLLILLCIIYYFTRNPMQLHLRAHFNFISLNALGIRRMCNVLKLLHTPSLHTFARHIIHYTYCILHFYHKVVLRDIIYLYLLNVIFMCTSIIIYTINIQLYYIYIIHLTSDLTLLFFL